MINREIEGGAPVIFKQRIRTEEPPRVLGGFGAGVACRIYSLFGKGTSPSHVRAQVRLRPVGQVPRGTGGVQGIFVDRIPQEKEEAAAGDPLQCLLRGAG